MNTNMQTTAPAQAITLHIGRHAPIAIQTLNQASLVYSAYLTNNELGSSEAPKCIIKANGKPVAHVSFNGRVWRGTKYVPKAVPLFDPYEIAVESFITPQAEFAGMQLEPAH